MKQLQQQRWLQVASGSSTRSAINEEDPPSKGVRRSRRRVRRAPDETLRDLAESTSAFCQRVDELVRGKPTLLAKGEVCKAEACRYFGT